MKHRTRRSLGLALALLLALSLILPAAAADTDELTRGDLVIALYRLSRSSMGDMLAIPFDDVQADTELGAAVAWAANQRVVNGYGDRRFGPGDPVTREQMAAIFYRYAQSRGQGFRGMWYFLLDYPDAADVAEWAYEAMHWAVMHEIIVGTDQGRLDPKGGATVGQLDLILERYTAAMGWKEFQPEMPSTAPDVILVNEGLKLVVPGKFAVLTGSETLVNDENGILFAVWETKSVNVARARDPEAGWGAGWLFSIGKADEARLHDMLTEDMSGVVPFATDGKGTCYLLYRPTDVRLERTGEITEADVAQWNKLNGLADAVRERFILDNGLTPYQPGDSEPETLP